MKIKICGIKYRDNLQEILKFQPDYLGFILYPGSPRYMEDSLVPEDLNTIPESIISTAVFVNEEIEQVLAKVEAFNFQAVQLHGNESAEYLHQLGKHLSSDIKVIKAFGIDEAFDWAVLKDYQDCTDLFLFDTKTANYGGSGKRFDHALLKNYGLDHPVMISGGIGIEELDDILDVDSNVIEVIDMNSKLEISPGVKDIDSVKKAITKVKAVDFEDKE